MNYLKKTVALGVVIFSLSGCGTVYKAVKHGTLDVQTRMSESVFLDPISESKKTVLIQIKNTSDKKDLQIAEEIKDAVRNKGYRVVSDPKDANIMIQANILQVGKSNAEDPFSSLESGYGNALAGGIAGGLIGNNWQGVGVGALVGGVIGTVADAAVQVVNYSIITDLQISERVTGAVVNESSNAHLRQGTSGVKTSSWSEKTHWKKYQTRIISSAKKTNLKFETALPELKKGLVESIAGIL